MRLLPHRARDALPFEYESRDWLLRRSMPSVREPIQNYTQPRSGDRSAWCCLLFFFPTDSHYVAVIRYQIIVLQSDSTYGASPMLCHLVVQQSASCHRRRARTYSSNW